MSAAAKPRIGEVIVVEGRYDKNTLAQIVDATIVETHGFGVFSDTELIPFLRRLAQSRGIIVMTDSDGAGFMIRSHLKGTLGTENLKHAYIPDVPGRERRKRSASKAGMLGVEGMPPDVILQSLRAAGATFLDESKSDAAHEKLSEPVTKLDLYELGLTGRENSAARRAELLAYLQLPRLLKPNALLTAVNCLFTRPEFLDAVSELDSRR